ncbi:homoaconitate hydratase [Pyrodictium occultum]|uniref:2-isopropylmalate synthase n=2 Tax=Pyrodictium occultum TaxID=2309 RepID=A0A0V8RX79_PYROC|nr:homoaconitate hydratase [Pyrodictium occultum]
MPGVELDLKDKIEILRALDELGVDIIEAGFPASSEIDRRAVQAAVREATRARIAALARASPRDVDEAAAAEAHIIHVFIATSDVHMKYKLRMTREQVIKRAVEAVERARSYGAMVLFSAEDATRSDPGFLVQVYRAVVEAGARYINIPDTVGTATPWYMEWLVSLVRGSLPPGVWIDVHCHDDFGLATANTLAGLRAGADGVQVTVNGFGERGGNAALEEVVAALHFLMGRRTGVRLELLTPVSRLVARKFGVEVPPNKAIVGRNAFAHEAGIHVHGVLRNPATYEPIEPEAVGNKRRIVLGRHSGRAAVEWALSRMGFTPEPGLVKHILNKLKEAAPRMKKVDEDTLAGWVAEYMAERGRVAVPGQV